MTRSGESSFAAARERVASLAAAIAAAEGSPPRLVETAISWVLVGRETPHKIKKPVRLPYLDFSTLAARRRFCDEELRINRRFAPELYLDVVDIRAGAAGASFGGTGPLCDVAVRMRRFADGALWSERLCAGALGMAEVEGFARRLAAAHRIAAIAPPTSDFGSTAAHARIARGSIAAIDGWMRRVGGGAAKWPALREWLELERERLALHWSARLAAGQVRECHGDLHLANVVQLGEQAVAFDALEFDPALRWIDPLDDAAFLMMDLLAHDRRDLAFRFLDVYLEASGDHDGLPALRFFLVSRALVRAQVGVLYEARGIEAQGARAAIDYLRLAAATRASRSRTVCRVRARASSLSSGWQRSVRSAFAPTSSASACSAWRRCSLRTGTSRAASTTPRRRNAPTRACSRSRASRSRPAGRRSSTPPSCAATSAPGSRTSPPPWQRRSRSSSAGPRWHCCANASACDKRAVRTRRKPMSRSSSA